MDYRIIRGKNQIGGTITEIESLSGTKIWVDFGAELSVEPEESTDAVMIDKIRKEHPEAVIFTHIHGDHIGLLYAVPKDIDIYMGELSRDMMLNIRETLIDVPDMDAKEKEKITTELRILKSEQVKLYQNEVPRQIGDITFTPYRVDHSVADAYMLRFDCDGRSIVHTGDFRSHGRLGKNLIDDIKSGIASRPVDVLIIEGTMMSRKNEKCKSEQKLEKEATSLLAENKYAFLICSSTNMESLASFYWATIKAGKIRSKRDKKEYKPALICNSYVKKQLSLFTEKIGEKEDWRFQFHRSYRISNSLKQVFKGKTQKQRMIDDGFTMLVGTSDYYRELMREFKDLNPKPLVFYSMWDGYVMPNKPYSNEKLIDLKEEWSDVFKSLHTSGHASVKTLTDAIIAMNPRERIVPIHTENAGGFLELKLPKELMERMEIEMPESDLRDADECLNQLSSDFKEDYDFIVKKAVEKTKDGIYKYYLGVRNNRIILYYMGSKVGEISIGKKPKKIKVDIDDYYKNKKGLIDFTEYKGILEGSDGIIKRAEEYAYGHRKDKNSQIIHYEKICQQWIISNNNSNPKSKWYFTDMEYTDGVLPVYKRFGRFDLIAVRKEKVHGEYPVALVELKVGLSAFPSSKPKSNNEEIQAARENAYEELGKNLYADPQTLFPGFDTFPSLRYGSGLVSHIADFLRYLNCRTELYEKRLKKEIINSIRVHRDIGELDKSYFKDIKESELSDYPEIHFALFTELPKELQDPVGNKDMGSKTITINDLKEKWWHYLFVSKGHALKDFFGTQLDGFLKYQKEGKEKLLDGGNTITIKQKVKNDDHEYEFHFKFVDPDRADPWDILNAEEDR